MKNGHSAPRSPPSPTRRAGRFSPPAEGEATVNELAAPHAMSLPSVSRHLKVLEQAGLVVKGRSAQWRPCRLDAARWQRPTRGWRRTATSSGSASHASRSSSQTNGQEES